MKLTLSMTFLLSSLVFWGCSDNAPEISSMTNPPTYHSGTGNITSEHNKDVKLNQNELQKVQTLLKALGYLDRVSTDMRPEVRGAIKKYQQDNELIETGHLNTFTLEHMGINYEEKEESKKYTE